MPSAGFIREKIGDLMQEALLLFFAKPPLPGQVKTRLIAKNGYAGLRAEQACAFYIYCLHTLCGNFFHCNVFDALFALGNADEEQVVLFCRQFQLTRQQILLLPKNETNIGNLMELALENALQLGYSKQIVLGTDMPQLSLERVKQAILALDTADLVLGPDQGGGLYLVGTRRPLGLFRQPILWSQGTDFEEVKQLATLQNIKVFVLPEEMDVDTWDDLQMWQNKFNKIIFD